MALPDEVRAAAARAIEALTPRIAPRLGTGIGPRWVPAENLHATVAFLGETSAADAVVDAVTAAAAPWAPVSLRLEGLGAFPSARRARVLWAGLGGDVAAMTGIAAAVSRVLEPLGFESEARPFRPHVTLARLPAPGRIDFGAVSVGPVPFSADGLSIFRSHLGRPAPRYERIAFAPFLG